MTAFPEGEVITRFLFHPATEQTAPLHDLVRQSCLELALGFNAVLPPSVETQRAITCLQEAMMWANSAIAIHLAPASFPETPEGEEQDTPEGLCGAAASTERGEAFTCTLTQGHEGLHMSTPTP